MFRNTPINPKIESLILEGDVAGCVDITGKTPKETALNFRKALSEQLHQLRERKRNDDQKKHIAEFIKGSDHIPT